MSFEAGATIPVAFLTAYYALVWQARLERGEWVLIHGGAGGVGMAAIQIAQARGAQIIATAGSQAKRDLLRSSRRRPCSRFALGRFRRRRPGDHRRRCRRRPQQPRRRGDGAQHRLPASVRPLRRARQARLRRQHPYRPAAVPPEPHLFRRRPRPADARPQERRPEAVRRADAAVRRRDADAAAVQRVRARTRSPRLST